ncbi:MAG: RNA 2',3'-cyclic phosphodiesterase [Clostridia bacterium]|nr:RNA 2',3'-cyclic phosphodiesterase [Clostridia bacterium]
MRLFFGLSLPDSIRAVTRACAESAAACVPGRYALAGNHHVTLAFLGDVPPERLRDARDVLARCAAAFPAPTLTLCGFDHFGRRENAILILRVKSDPPLAPLHDRLVQALAAAGLPADPGPFSPHITLARHAVLPDALPACPPASFRAVQAHVFLSARDGAGVLRYTPLETVPFACPGGEN